MKKTSFVILAGLVALGFSSCRKEYTCKCTTKVTGSTDIVREAKTSKMSLKDARKECDKGDNTTLNTECEISL